jgi:hypothetical protein
MREKFSDIPESWSDEQLIEKTIEPIVAEWMNYYFDMRNDHITGDLLRDLIRISRHIAKNSAMPEFHPFTERESYNLDKVVSDLRNRSDDERYRELMTLFDKQGSLWKFFYKDFNKFLIAFELSKMRKILIGMGGHDPKELVHIQGPERDVVLTDDEREQIKKRDNYTCQCCFRYGKGIRLEIDHIIPVFQGGSANVENSQTLCRECNSKKGTNAINFKSHTPPSVFKFNEPIYYSKSGREHPVNTLCRIINTFYYCQAVCDVHWNDRRNGKYYSIWEIELYQGNDPEMLKKHKARLLQHIRENLGCDHLEDIKIITAGH